MNRKPALIPESKRERLDDSIAACERMSKREPIKSTPIRHLLVRDGEGYVIGARELGIHESWSVALLDWIRSEEWTGLTPGCRIEVIEESYVCRSCGHPWSSYETAVNCCDGAAEG